MTGFPETDPDEAYQGDQAEHIHAAYTDASGEILFFTVDDQVYDHEGWRVGVLNTSDEKRGFSERLILPMGNDCRRFGILYSASAESNESYSSTQDRMRLYFATYDLDGTDPISDYAVGGLDGQANGTGASLTDIADRDGTLYGSPSQVVYGYSGFGVQGNYRANYQIAATELIDGCFYYVFVFDGLNIIRYKLTTDDLEWDNYIVEIPDANSNTEEMRTEMEMIKLSNGDYRLAIPTNGSGGTGISIYDISSTNFELSASSRKYIDLGLDGGTSGNNAQPIGLEFDASGRYLYFTHENNLTPQWASTVLDVFDFNTGNIVTSSLPSLTNIANYQVSFIERFGNTLFLATDNAIGTLENSHMPISAIWTDANYTLNAGYGSSVNENPAFYERYILPEQVDMAYPEVVDMSCECCREYLNDTETYTTTTNEVWSTVLGNPISSSNDIYIRDELRISAGTTLEISGLNLFFGPDAKVIVERGDQTIDGGVLIMDGTVFTADLRCNDRTFDDCQGPEDDCNDLFWRGVRVLGYDTEDQPASGSTIQGRLVMKNNSMVEYAMAGVWAGDLSCTGCGGGIIEIFDSRLKDNLVGVKFSPYVRTLTGGAETYNRSLIRYTNFTRTSDIPIDSRLVHVDAEDCSTIRLRANIYRNEAWASYTPEFRGIGVLANDASIEEKWQCNVGDINCPEANIVRSQYLNLHKGIDASSTIDVRTIYVGHAEFRNNWIGVHSIGLIAPQILDNDFFVINRNNAAGIYLTNSTGYAVENNNFEAMALTPVVWMFGIAVQSSGDEDNEIYNNYFRNLYIGIVSTGQNADYQSTDPQNPCGSRYDIGLKYFCNQFDRSIPYADIYLHDGNISDVQGTCNPPGEPARNVFSHNGGGAFDFRVRTSNLLECPSEPFEIDYRHNEISDLPTPLEARLVPIERTPNRVFPSFCENLFATSDMCPVRNTSLPQPAGGPKSGDSSKSLDIGDDFNPDDLFEVAASIYSEAALSANDEDTYSAQKLKSDFWKEVIRWYQWDTLGQATPELMSDLLSEFNADGYAGRFAAALSHKSGVEDFSWVSDVNRFESSAADISIVNAVEGELPMNIEGIVDNGSFNYANFTRSINELYDEHEQYFNPYIPLPEDAEFPESYASSEDAKSGSTDISKDPMIGIQPNPFEDSFLLTLKNFKDYGEIRIEIYDIFGKRLKDFRLGESEFIEIDASDLPSGVMVYRVFADGKLIEAGQIVKSE